MATADIVSGGDEDQLSETLEKSMQEPTHGAMQIDGKPVTSVRFERLEVDNNQTFNISFFSGKKLVSKLKDLDLDALTKAVGENNAIAIIKHADAKSILKGEALQHAYGRSPEESNKRNKVANEKIEEVNNIVENGTDQVVTMDTEVLKAVSEMVARRRHDLNLRRQINLSNEKTETEIAHSVTEDKNGKEQQSKEDDNNAVPASVTRRFIRIKEKFFFPDETLAFIDKGESLNARAEHKEVVTAIVSIAEARGWDKITVKGTKVFRHAVWLDAALRGIDARGYTPSEIDKVKLEMALAKSTDKSITETGKQTKFPENSVEKGHDQKVTKSLDATPHPANENIDGAPLREHTGILVAHGKNYYKHDPKESMNYWVKIRGEDGKEETIWGKDLERAINEDQFTAGEKIKVAFMGNVPVTVKVKTYDENGKFKGNEDVTTHRNEWNVIKAEAFRSKERGQAVKEHPELAGAYGTMAAANAFAKEKLNEKSKETQEHFMALIKETLAKKIVNGQRVPEAKIMEQQPKTVDANREIKSKDKCVEQQR